MSRTGAEGKPPWQALPLAIRRATAETLGAAVRRAARIWGGYAPSVTFRLTLADGRRAFFKGVNATSNDHMRRALVQEERVYRELGPRLSPWAPAFFGAFKRADWHVLLLEDLGPADTPPWTAGKARRAAHAYAEFHRATYGQALPRWLPRSLLWGKLFGRWDELTAEPAGLDHLAALAGARAAEARAWLDEAVPTLRQASKGLATIRPPYSLLHFDTRSDNMRLTGGRLRLFDWPFACAGPPEVDAAAFAQSIACEGGPAPEDFIAWYATGLPLRDPVLDHTVATIAGYFASMAWRPPVPGLPRLRSIQRRQLRASLAWAARRLHLPPPSWLEAVPD